MSILEEIIGIFHAIKSIKESKPCNLQCLTCHKSIQYNGNDDNNTIDLDKYIKCECGNVNYIISFSNDKNKPKDINKENNMDNNEEINEMSDLVIIDNYFKVENSILLYLINYSGM